VNAAPICTQLLAAKQHALTAETACGVAAWVYRYSRAWNGNHDAASTKYLRALEILQHGVYVLEIQTGPRRWERDSKLATRDLAEALRAQALNHANGSPTRVRFDATVRIPGTRGKVVTKTMVASISTLANLG